MRKDGMGRSNALPILQLALGAGLVVLGLVAVGVNGSWTDWALAVAGAVQVIAGVIGIRVNQRLDRDDASGS